MCMKKIFKIMILVSTITICIGLTGCKSKEEKAEEKRMENCISSIQKGLENRWKIIENVTTDINKLHEQKKKGVAEELKTAKSYKDTKFKDKKFNNLVHSYVSALESQEQGIEFEFTDSKKYEELYNKKGYDVRSKDLKKLVKNYKLEVASKYKDTLDDVIKDNRRKRISIGDNVTANTQYGKVQFCVDEFVRTHDQDKDIKKDEIVELLRAKVYNVSFKTDDYVTMKDVFTMKSMDGYNINVWDLVWEDSSQYDIDTTYLELPEGQGKKVAWPYILPKDTDMVYLEIGDKYDMILKVQK